MRGWMLVVLLGVSACSRPCESTCTSGCCDSNGLCQGGRTDSQCGSAGRACGRCVGGSCTASGFCGTTTGSGGGGGSSSTCVGVGSSCAINNDCCTFRSGTGYCVSGRCADACNSNAECNSNCCAVLVSGNRACSGSSACTSSCRATGALCSVNGDCCNFLGGTGYCVDDVCRDSCLRNSECVSGCCAPLVGGGSVCNATQFCR